MEYFFLDLVRWGRSQTLYHAAAHLGREALIILRPATPYVCLGFHQDAQQEIDLDFARQMGIPVFRREVGGGAVYLDSGQLFYQLILRKDHPDLPADKAEFYRKFLEPVVETYRQFGVPAEFKPVNDIIANNRKVSGNGAAEIQGSSSPMAVLVGNFILDFNYEMMSKILKVPDEKFRDKVYKTLSENLSTLRRETGSVPATADLAAALSHRFEALLGPLERKTEVDLPLSQEADRLLALMDTPEWLLANDRRGVDSAQVRIREGVTVIQKVVKLPGGLVRASAISRDGHLSDVHISGDFFFYPQSALVDLEQALEGAPADPEKMTQIIQDFYQEHLIETPGISPQSLAGVLVS